MPRVKISEEYKKDLRDTGLGPIPEKSEGGQYVDNPYPPSSRERTFEELVNERDNLRERLQFTEEIIKHRLVQFGLL